MTIDDMMWRDYDYHVNTGELGDYFDDEDIDDEELLDYEEDPD